VGLGLFSDLDHVAGANLVRRDVDPTAIDGNAVVAKHLTRLGAGRAETHAVAHRIQARLEHRQQVLAGDALAAFSTLVGQAELAFQNAVDAANLLLFAQLHAITGQAGTAFLAVLAGRIGAAFDCALVSETLFAFQEELFAFAAALTAFGIKITSHDFPW
jgi:hypothetical protein